MFDFNDPRKTPAGHSKVRRGWEEEARGWVGGGPCAHHLWTTGCPASK